MASSSSIHQLEEHGDEEGENDDRHGSQITSPLRILTSLFPCSGKWDSYCSVRFISVLCPCHAVQPSSRRRRGSPEKEEREVGDDDDDSSPIEQVALTVPVGDEPATPVLTFRMWVLGTASCAALSFLNAFFGYRKEPLTITAVSAQIAVLPLGRLMAAALPEGAFFQGRPWEFTLNPGPFNMKEHVLITIFANAGAGTVFGMNLVTSVRVFYGQHMSFLVALIIILTSQVLGFGWAGIFRRYLVEPAAMWWPSNLVQVSLFRALHEKERRRKGRMTRNQFFLVAFICSFAYYVFPGYLFQMLTSLSWICWVFPSSVMAQQLGSGLHGLGIGAIGLDWSSISSYLGSPLASPWFATANIAAGFFIVMYIITPINYWFNVYKARNFPIYSDGLYTETGQKYNISSIMDSQFYFDTDAYEKNGPLYISTFFASSYGLGFACLTATVSHVLLFHGSEIYQLSKSAFKDKKMDIHTKLMRRYRQVPEWWFICILVASVAVTMLTCEYYIEQLQLPWWGVLLACALAIFYTLPIGIIKATTNQAPGLNVITEYIMGYLYPGRPIANMCFKVYGYVGPRQALEFLQDFKLGHYMKIPPRTMFMAQLPCLINHQCKFSHLKFLKLMLFFREDVDTRSLVSFLRSAPFIENLEMNFSIFAPLYVGDEPVTRFPQRPHNYLTDLFITRFEGYSGQLEFLFYMVENAPALEILTVDRLDIIVKQRRWEDGDNEGDQAASVHRAAIRSIEGKISPVLYKIALVW